MFLCKKPKQNETKQEIAKFDRLERQRCEDIKEIVAPYWNRHETFRDFWETGPGTTQSIKCFA